MLQIKVRPTKRGFRAVLADQGGATFRLSVRYDECRQTAVARTRKYAANRFGRFGGIYAIVDYDERGRWLRTEEL